MYDTRIPLLGRGADIMGALDGATLQAQRENQFMQDRKRQELFQKYGPAIMAGDKSALAQYAQIDPVAAQNMRSSLAAERRANRESLMSGGGGRNDVGIQAEEVGRVVSAFDFAKPRFIGTDSIAQAFVVPFAQSVHIYTA